MDNSQNKERWIKMTLEEFKKRLEAEDEWSPGWDAIESVFSALYPEQQPMHYGSVLTSRAIVGGNEYLDGYSIYNSPNNYKHIVTFGMTELYANEDALGEEWNGWGYEMTIKLAEQENDACMWAISLLGNLARYTYTQERFFEPFQFIAGDGNSICRDRDSQITALMAVYDTEAKGIDTIYGKTEFIQLVGITEQELDALKENRENAKRLYELMIEDNPNLVTDLNRTKSYL